MEFITIMRFDDLQVVKDFVGDALTRRSMCPTRPAQVLSRFDDRSQHYELRETLQDRKTAIPELKEHKDSQCSKRASSMPKSTARRSSGARSGRAEGEVHAIMGPNGSGKSTLAYVLAGQRGLRGHGRRGLLERRRSSGDGARRARPARASSSPSSIRWRFPASPSMTFLRTAINAHRKARGEAELDDAGFHASSSASKAATLEHRSFDMLKRPVNVGFSGGEKKRAEILQMALLEPTLCVLDETDSGLDIDALRIVAEGVNALRSPDRAFLVITHYQRLLNYIVPDKVHVMAGGRIAKSGGKELALELERVAATPNMALTPMQRNGERT